MLDKPERTKEQSHPNASSTAYGKIPETSARDKTVGEAELVLTAYRSTFTKGYAMRAGVIRDTQIVKETNGRTGFGLNVIKGAIAAMRKRGTIQRPRQAPGVCIEETFTMLAPAVGYVTVWQWWFSALVTVKAMAAWLFLQAGTGKGPTVWAREFRERFGWQPRTCGKVMRELDEMGLL
jgi:hypothetical protein